ncbi:39S ribosomal protein L52 mitochondrial [Biomphalaria pfeifferi]|uniref:Large ribosomal subunit protein mL52 n=1 Tax=Biomphalaria pfeifferi TaxID=112525 RepID=A0AAD8AZD5_BIOPF|nr:39S ribosomal protein L52 mitochondrial [Biomphalaria pfeifferi]
MAASIVRSKECLSLVRTCPLLSSAYSKVLIHPSHSLHTSHTFLIDRRKDRAIAQYLYYQDHEKTLRHRNLSLVEMPDYSYIDGRPTELGDMQKSRQEKNYALTKQIVQLLEEIKMAQNELIANTRQEEETQQKRLASALNAKGTDL